MSIMLGIIGMAGMAGAIERGTSIIPPLVITIIGFGITFYKAWREENEEEANHGSRPSDYIDYPSEYERSSKRRA